jgi:hypothetical protein
VWITASSHLFTHCHVLSGPCSCSAFLLWRSSMASWRSCMQNVLPTVPSSSAAVVACSSQSGDGDMDTTAAVAMELKPVINVNTAGQSIPSHSLVSQSLSTRQQISGQLSVACWVCWACRTPANQPRYSDEVLQSNVFYKTMCERLSLSTCVNLCQELASWKIIYVEDFTTTWKRKKTSENGCLD